MSHDAYARAARKVANPRDVEYMAFGEATRRLIEADETGRADLKALGEALFANRTLWGALASDCTKAGNALPPATRAQIISLSAFVDRYSGEVMRKRESLQPLIDINRIMMEGLAGRGPGPAA